ncbi:hypothetical protein ANN_12052 [Periplaneta americana]|uniref:Uncharacterized protein n=1 Tax=Periplaneta americana TaxID=6978 RepID=A0ABQ8T898_PERAM|nr:hypothetical protein ANN_12052 [Periplaneta americana]
MSPGSSTESYPAFAHIGLRENPGKTSTRCLAIVSTVGIFQQCGLRDLRISNRPTFLLWGYLKERVFLTHPTTLLQLKDAISQEITNIPRHYLQNAVHGVADRMLYIEQENRRTFSQYNKIKTSREITVDNAGEMSPGSSTESYPAFARIGLRENPGKNLNQVTCPDRDSNPGHLVSRPDALTDTPQKSAEDAPFSIKSFLCHSYPHFDFLAAAHITVYSTLHYPSVKMVDVSTSETEKQQLQDGGTSHIVTQGLSPGAPVPLWNPNKSPSSSHRGCSVDQPPMAHPGQRLCRISGLEVFLRRKICKNATKIVFEVENEDSAEQEEPNKPSTSQDPDFEKKR